MVKLWGKIRLLQPLWNYYIQRERDRERERVRKREREKEREREREIEREREREKREIGKYINVYIHTRAPTYIQSY